MKLLAPSVPASPFSVMSGLATSQPFGNRKRTSRMSLKGRSLTFWPSMFAGGAVPMYLTSGDMPLADFIAGKPDDLRSLFTPSIPEGRSLFAP